MRHKPPTPEQIAANLLADGRADLAELLGAKVVKAAVRMRERPPPYAYVDPPKAETPAPIPPYVSSAEAEVCKDWRALPYARIVGVGADNLFLPRETWRELYNYFRTQGDTATANVCALAAKGDVQPGNERLIGVAMGRGFAKRISAAQKGGIGK